MQRLRAILGFESCTGINYCTLDPKDIELAKRLKEKRLEKLNSYALPSVILSIICLIIVLPMTLTESLNFKVKVFYMVRFTILCLNCTIWYLLRNKFQSFVQIYTLILYACYTIFSFVFPELGPGD